ncbi:hatching enzyme 1.2-like isoform X1 [Schistocerca nitens]|uniref:hatching enzyme 1.2-like isoform X1 n=2 Tax=Schistocerca nitens TaxID=7011 RepID=UPI002117FE25|nr:hatching enzyme 1.2-like isoform X1 [Schistocerca nitens]
MCTTAGRLRREVTPVSSISGNTMIKLLLMSYLLSMVTSRTLNPLPSSTMPPVPNEGRMSIESLNALQETDHDPEVKPGLFQGDMAMTNEMYEYWRVGLRWDVFPEKLWTNGTVPYYISPLYEPDDYITIYKAINILNFMTCVKFVPWNGKQKDYLLIWPIKYPKGCWSFVGKHGGAQIISLQPPDSKGPNCLGQEGRSIHELLHALGLFHEQSRADRDQFVEIVKENIIPEFLNNFNKQSLENTTYSFEYDYDSIMHYGAYFFSKEKGKPTIVAKNRGVKLGQRRAMSKTDCLKINDLYGCLTKSAYHRRKYYTLCNFMGI